MKQLKKFYQKSNKIIVLAVLLVTLIFVLAIYQISILKRAHSSFENYYSFRGCRELIQRTADWGTCKLSDGSTIKIVKYQGRWFLDGDLPGGFLSW